MNVVRKDRGRKTETETETKTETHIDYTVTTRGYTQFVK